MSYLKFIIPSKIISSLLCFSKHSLPKSYIKSKAYSPVTLKLRSFSSSQHNLSQHEQNSEVLIYEGASIPTTILLKRLSICSATVVSLFSLVTLTAVQHPTIPYMAQFFLCFSLFTTSTMTTFLLHKLSTHYVIRIFYTPSPSPTLKIQTLTLFGSIRTESFPISKLNSPPLRNKLFGFLPHPFSSFNIGEKFFFVGKNFPPPYTKEAFEQLYKEEVEGEDKTKTE